MLESYEREFDNIEEFLTSRGTDDYDDKRQPVWLMNDIQTSVSTIQQENTMELHGDRKISGIFTTFESLPLYKNLDPMNSVTELRSARALIVNGLNRAIVSNLHNQIHDLVFLSGTKRREIDFEYPSEIAFPNIFDTSTLVELYDIYGTENHHQSPPDLSPKNFPHSSRKDRAKFIASLARAMHIGWEVVPIIFYHPISDITYDTDTVNLHKFYHNRRPTSMQESLTNLYNLILPYCQNRDEIARIRSVFSHWGVSLEEDVIM